MEEGHVLSDYLTVNLTDQIIEQAVFSFCKFEIIQYSIPNGGCLNDPVGKVRAKLKLHILKCLIVNAGI